MPTPFAFSAKKTALNFFANHRFFLAFVSPLALFFLLGALIPHADVGSETVDGGVSAEPYFWLTVARVVLISTVLLFFFASYRSILMPKSTWIGLGVGVIGGVIWVSLCAMGLENKAFAAFNVSHDWVGQRSSVDPWDLYPGDVSRGCFFAFRFALLVVVVPLAEELFLRGWFIRFVDSDEWQQQSLGEVGWIGMMSATAYGVLTHPNEFVAAIIWFSLVTLLMKRTNSLWACVVAHATTNAILGLYIVWTGSWSLW